MAKHKGKKAPTNKKPRGVEIEIEIEKKHKKAPVPAKKGGKVAKVMSEFKHGELHSGSKKGPKVTNPKQAIAIAMNESRKYGSSSEMKKK